MRWRPVSIYTRQKQHGKWRYQRVRFGRGKKHSDVTGPFYFRLTPEGRRCWQPATGSTLQEAIEGAETLTHGLNAAQRGLTVSEFDEVTSVHRVSIKTASAEFLALKKSKAPRTLRAYTLHLQEFQESWDRRTRYLDDIDADTLRKFREHMARKGHSGKTQHNRLLTVIFMLKKNGIKNPLGWDEFPTVEVEAAVPFESGELKKLFDTMTDEDRIRYRFFLGTGAGEQEVSFATWADLDLHKSVFHIRAKPEHGFTLKTHEARSVPMPAPLVAALKERKKGPAHSRWIFVNESGKPEGHFLRKFKVAAMKAGLNCGHCVGRTQRLTGAMRAKARQQFYEKHGAETLEEQQAIDGQFKESAEVTCKTHPVCSQF